MGLLALENDASKRPLAGVWRADFGADGGVAVHGFSRHLRCPKVSKGERREDARRVALGQPGLPLAD